MSAQTINEKIEIAINCYYEDRRLLVSGHIWASEVLKNDDPPFPGVTIYQGGEIVSLLALKLYGENPPRDRISQTTYKKALKLFKMFHIKTDPAYRKRPLIQEKGEIRFTRGKKKRGV